MIVRAAYCIGLILKIKDNFIIVEYSNTIDLFILYNITGKLGENVMMNKKIFYDV